MSVSVYTGTDVTVSAQILADSAQLDLCVLELSQPTELRALPVNVNGAQRGEAVYAIGFPVAADVMSDTAAQLSSEATVTDGIISATRQYTMSSYGAPVTLLQINAAINSGISGDPLFNASGEVVGINTLTISDSIGVNGAIHAGELQRFLLDHALPYIDSAAPAAAPCLLPAATLCLSPAATVLPISAPTRWRIGRISAEPTAGCCPL